MQDRNGAGGVFGRSCGGKARSLLSRLSRRYPFARIEEATTSRARQLAARRNKARNADPASAVIHSHSLASASFHGLLLDREIVVETSAYASISLPHLREVGFIDARPKIKIFSFRDSTFEKPRQREREREGEEEED